MSGYAESATEAWKIRFGTAAPPEAEVLEKFFVHRSVRDYEDRPVDESLVATLIGAAQSASTSSNLQMWSVVSVQDPERRKEIGMLCGDQGHVYHAPWFFAFFADHHRIRHAASKVGEGSEGLGFTEYFVMAIIDAALAAERFVCAAESLGLGVCYIGALRNQPEKIKELLELPPGVFGVFGLTLGWPKEPVEAHVKPRMDAESVWFKERYQSDVDLSGFEARLKSFIEDERMRGDVSWSKRSGRRVDRKHLTGREVLHSWLKSQGMNLE